MVDEGLSKNQNQKKKLRHESCINNVKIQSKLSNRHQKRPLPQHPIDHNTYTKKASPTNEPQRNHTNNHYEQLQQQIGSLENISSNPWGGDYNTSTSDTQSSLRRTRSLAITRDDIFISNQEQHQQSYNRRPQLIPRAKLIDRTRYNTDYRTGAKRQSSEDRAHQSDDNKARPISRQTSVASFDPNYQSIQHLANPKFYIGNESNNHHHLDENYNQIIVKPKQEGLSLPNYYPDSKYDTDNISLTDNQSLTSSSKKYSSSSALSDNLSNSRWTINESESIPYDENIVLSANRALYDTVPECHYAKPKTIRGPTPYNQTYSTPNKRHSFNNNTEEVKNQQFEPTAHVIEINEGEEPIQHQPVEVPDEDELKIEEEIFEKQQTPAEEEYRTIVEVRNSSPEVEETEEEKNKHSHNYLKEFLESQKGSRKPLQSYLAKKFTNLSRRNSKESTSLISNLADNRFYSLPDITASKNLRKCEKIDRKLRKCQEPSTKKTENRFIVNIGKHFDITANTNVPVDFEVKIAKIPRKAKSKKSKSKADQQFIEAVKNLKHTLNPKVDDNHNILTRPEIVSLTSKQPSSLEENLREVNEITMNLQQEGKTEKEYQEKLGTMRTYWNSLTSKKSFNDEETKCKIVDTQSKIDEVKKKFEPEETKPEKPNKVKLARQLFEQKPIIHQEKISPFIKETCNYFEKPKNGHSTQFESLNPNIMEIIQKDDAKKQKQKKTNKPNQPEFDHVRYRVVKSDVFQKKIFANCEKESQFDGLMQYLQDYSFQELLRDNNIVIIEPIRTKIPHESRTNTQTRNVTPLLHRVKDEDDDSNLKRHFFYHPIRVNKEVNDDELPNPDTVKQVRQFFEGGLTRSQSSQEFNGIVLKTTENDPDKDHCSGSDSNKSNCSDFDSQENLYETIEHCCNQQYVSEEILKKIREYGSTITYYGGRVLNKQLGQPTFTKAIMEEIKRNELRKRGDCSCVRMGQIAEDGDKDGYQGVKFRLVKSNSCSSRLELVGTNDLEKSKEKYVRNKEKQMRHLNQLKKVKEVAENEKENCKEMDKNAINETIKMTMNLNNNQPRIIGEERKVMTQWGDVSKEKTFTGISFNNSSKPVKMTHQEYRNYEQNRAKTNLIDDMEFEAYEVA